MSAAGWYLRNISPYCLSYYCPSILVLTAEQTPMGHRCTLGALVDWLQKWMDLSPQSTKPEHCHHPSFSTEYAQRIWLRTEYFNITIQTLSWLTGNPENGFLSWLLCVPPFCIHHCNVLLNTADAEEAGWAQLYVNQAFSWNVCVSVVTGFLNYNLVCLQWSNSNCYDLEKLNSILVSN